ncbi:transcriptional regulator family: Fungal Specific TF [Penicillium roqueforti]|uniref:transcriptional regulator family: Fungal Specific TF n=1 Tax=Penicillium roqueforti TaxID=5082 RepID=UPI001909C950|nr:transcriptional regulator family: Fungal Specific TF [Penicillium roqueforti]KAF9253849.1 transcriptional regulator family: Fungal Specific TF [Penicillium roqueforti]KAI3167705.1 transcriptional regulator family: Fungal Specific TF [Penicillium roqueforti]
MVFTLVENMWNSPETEGMNTNQRAFFLSKKLFETHSRALDVYPSMTWENFQSAAAGRWELIGLLFTLTGLATDWVPHSDRVFMRPNMMDPKSLAVTATAVGDICLQFCDSTGIVNDIVAWLLLHQVTLLAIVYGESDFRPWRKLGELSTTLFALGLHQDSSKNAPFFLSEMRKRTMVAAYFMDKGLATFLGRPPLISWRYCDIQMPLDLSVEEVFADSAVRNAAIARLDEETGWNLESSLMKGTWPRISLITSVFREKVLELSLSRQLDNLSQRVEELSRESRQLRQGLPEFLHWKPNIDGALISKVEYDLLFEVHIEFLYNDFLLYRTLGKRTQTQPEEVLGIAREILKTLVIMISQKTRSRQPIKDIGLNVCLPGLPSAGVLCAELLRRSRSPVTSSSPEFPRSEVIQNLTLFAAYLDTIIQPNDSNYMYRVAQQGQKAIRHVLDQVLSVEGLSSAVEDTETSDKLIDDASLLGSVDIDDPDLFLGWLDGNMQHMSDSWLGWVNFT